MLPEHPTAEAPPSYVFVLPTYAVEQVENARHTARLARQHGFRAVIVCNSAKTAEALTDDPDTLSAGINVGYGGAATLVAGIVDFETLVLCNDDLLFTPDAMRALRAAIEGVHEAALIGFLPRDEVRVAPLPGVLGVVGIVCGLPGLTRKYQASRGRGPRSGWSPEDDGGARPLDSTLGFPFVCVAVTRRAWDALDGFDAHFPLYFEDTDVLTRAHRSTAIEVRVAAGDCTHFHSATGRTLLPYILPLMAVGARNFLQLHRRSPRWMARLLVTVGLAVRAACWLPIRPNRLIEGRSIARAARAVWSSRPPPMPPWR